MNPMLLLDDQPAVRLTIAQKELTTMIRGGYIEQAVSALADSEEKSEAGGRSRAREDGESA